MIKEKQPVFYNIINNQFKHNKIPHAFLLIGEETSDTVNFLAQSLLCSETTLACGKCPTCQRVANNTYADIISFDGQTNTIKRENIAYIQEEFHKTALEGSNRIYIIKNIDNSSIEAMNALLKLLEEPQAGIYAIFTSSKLNRVLPTIRSRCQIFELKQPNYQELERKLMALDIDKENSHLLVRFISNVSDLENLNLEAFVYLKQEAVYFLKSVNENNKNIFIDTYTHVLNDYDNKEDISIFLKLVLLGFEDMFHVKHNQEVNYSLSYKQFINKPVDDDKLTEQIKLVLEAIENIQYNANTKLLLDSLIYRLTKGEQ